MIAGKNTWGNDWGARKAKLKEARALAARRRELKWHKERDELSKGLSLAASRKRDGNPVDAPKARPWDFKKGRVIVPPVPPEANGQADRLEEEK